MRTWGLDLFMGNACKENLCAGQQKETLDFGSEVS